MSPQGPRPSEHGVQDLDGQAAEAYLRCRQGPWSTADQAALEARLADDAAFAEAFRRAGQLWQSVGTHAAAPELMAMREQAIARARRHHAGRWRERGPARWRIAAAVAGIGLALGLAFQFSPYGYRPGVYRTGLGEQRVVELDDHSRIALDAATRLRVRYSGDARLVELYEGQAQFSVAKDPTRPFKVQAGDRTVVALGTVFTVEYVDRQMRVAMLEGRVAVVPAARSAGADPVAQRIGSAPNDAIELGVGEGVYVAPDGRVTVAEHVDLEAATAWRRGKVVLNGVPLGKAVQRLNRYSRLQLEIEDPDLAALQVSGVFDAGDIRAFAEAVQAYLPVAADYADPRTVRLRNRE